MGFASFSYSAGTSAPVFVTASQAGSGESDRSNVTKECIMPLVTSKEILRPPLRGTLPSAPSTPTTWSRSRPSSMPPSRRAPVILQVSQGAIATRARAAAAMVMSRPLRRCARRAPLDHGTVSIRTSAASVPGSISLMYDGSKAPYEENGRHQPRGASPTPVASLLSRAGAGAPGGGR